MRSGLKVRDHSHIRILYPYFLYLESGDAVCKILLLA